MAITDDVIIAVSGRPGPGTDGAPVKSISLANVRPEFAARTIELTSDGDTEIDSTVLEWTNYVKAGLKGAIAYARQTGSPADFQPVDRICALVDGTVPPGAGLSSSSAMVCASAIAVLVANGITEIEKTALVEAAIIAERSVGVSSGGYVSIVQS